MFRVRIYLGCDNIMKLDTDTVRQKSQSIVSEYFPGFTVYYGTGFWKGNAEDVIIFEIVTDDINDVDKAKEVAMRLKKYFFQESVLFIVDTVNGEFI